MSETTSNAARQATPACEGESLIIEVIGKDHPKGHRFRIFDETNYEQQEWLENQLKVEDLEESVLHVWPWKGRCSGNVWLEIDAEDGAPVRVPFFEDVGSTPRQLHGQWNSVCPVVPLTAMEDPNPEPGQAPEKIMPIRPGFVYVFRKGTLWRELKASYSDAGTIQFADVRLSDFGRPGKPGVNSERRPAVGKPLSCIWLPLSQMSEGISSDFQLAFSQVQLSAQHLAHLELNESARKKRCQTVQGSGPQFLPQHEIAPGKLVSVSSLPMMRPREPELEKRLLRPWKQVYDLTGAYASDLFLQAKTEVELFRAGGEPAEDAWDDACLRDSGLRGSPAVRVDALLKASDVKGVNSEIWKALGDSEDALAPMKERGYAGVVLEDRLFLLWHAVTAGLESRRLVDSLLEAIEKKPHGDSAQLVYRLMGPERFGGKVNSLHSHLKEIDTSRFGPLHSNLLTAQRQLAREELADAQKRLAHLIRQADNQVAMADLFNLTGADYIEGFSCTSDLFQVLTTDPNSVDHLARVEAANNSQVRDAHELVIRIVEDGSNEPLHAMLFPSGPSDRSEKSSELLERSGVCGDGRCRPADIEQLPNNQPDANAVQTLTAAVLVGIAHHSELDLSSQSKRWMSGVGAILDALDKHVRSLAKRLQSAAYSLDSRIYGPLLRLAKARDPSLLGSVQLVARNAVPEGWVILGLHDPASGLKMGLTEAERVYAHKTNGHRKFYGEFLDSEGNQLASTRKIPMPDLEDAPEARQFHVYAAPGTSEVVRAQRSLRRLGSWDEYLDFVRVPYLVIVLEGHNVWNEVNLWNKTLVQKGRLRTIAGGMSALGDLTFAGVIAVERLSKDLGIWRDTSKQLSKAAISVNKEVFGRASKAIANAVPEIVTRRMLGGVITAGLTIAVSILDMVHEWDTGDRDAAVAYGFSAIGGGMVVMGSLMMAKMAEAGIAPILLGLGPWGWVLAGAAVAIGAGIFATILDDPPLLDWLKRGPFGREQDDSYPHLAESPQENYYRLVNLLTKPRISIKKVGNMHARLTEQGVSIDPWRVNKVANIDTVVKVESNLGAMLDAATLTVFMRLVGVVREPTRRGHRVQRKILQQAPEIVLEQPLLNGRAFYLALPPRKLFRNVWGQEGEKAREVRVKAQWQSNQNANGVSRSLIFPAPELHDDTNFDPAKHGAPVFSENKQVFWADDQTHEAEAIR